MRLLHNRGKNTTGVVRVKKFSERERVELTDNPKITGKTLSLR